MEIVGKDGADPKMVVYRRERNCKTEYALVNIGSYTIQDWIENVEQVYGYSAEWLGILKAERNQP